MSNDNNNDKPEINSPWTFATVDPDKVYKLHQNNVFRRPTTPPPVPETGRKLDAEKPMLSLIPAEAIILAGEAFTYGAKKYSAHNFKNGLAHGRLADAALRHIFAYLSGENLDPESGKSHIGHALASLSMLAYMMKHKPELDDRFNKGKV